MADNINNTTFTEEFPEGATPDTNVPETAETPVEKQTYELADGSQGSRAAFIREKFLNENMTRKEIAEKYGFPYRIVYSATVNMVNEAEAPTRGRSAGTSTIQVTEDNKVVLQKGDGLLVNGEPFPGNLSELGELKTVNRNEWIKSQVAAGMSRGDVAKALDMSYGVVYSMTKDAENTRQRIEIELADGSKVSRAEYIRMQYAAGVSRGDIAKELDVPYSVVWQATRTEKTEADQLKNIIDELTTLKDKATDPGLMDQIISALGTITFKEEAAEAAEAAEPAAETPTNF